jgi:hypothetical protein
MVSNCKNCKSVISSFRIRAVNVKATWGQSEECLSLLSTHKGIKYSLWPLSHLLLYISKHCTNHHQNQPKISSRTHIPPWPTTASFWQQLKLPPLVTQKKVRPQFRNHQLAGRDQVAMIRWSSSVRSAEAHEMGIKHLKHLPGTQPHEILLAKEDQMTWHLI